MIEHRKLWVNSGSLIIQEGKVRMLTSKVERRMTATIEEGIWMPRLERLAAV